MITIITILYNSNPSTYFLGIITTSLNVLKVRDSVSVSFIKSGFPGSEFSAVKYTV